jgi:hypothetical protein
LARVLARRERVTLTLTPDSGAPADPPRLRDVTRALADAFPALVGPVLSADGALGPGTLFSLDGRAVTEDLSLPVPEPDTEEQRRTGGARLLLLTSLEGGRR